MTTVLRNISKSPLDSDIVLNVKLFEKFNISQVYKQVQIVNIVGLQH